MKNYRTPRGMAECTFINGYPTLSRSLPTGGQVLNVVLALVIGACLGGLLVHGLTS